MIHFILQKEGEKVDNYIVKELTYYYNLQNKNGFEFAKSTLAYYVLTFVLEGSITYIVNGTEYVVRKNDAIFLTPGTTREGISSMGKPVWFVNFNFHTFEDFHPSLPTYLPNNFSPDIKKLLQIFPYTHILPNDFSKSKVTNLLNYILLDLMEKDSRKTQNAYVNKILKIIDERITEKLTLQVISSELKLSKEYISSIFKKETGKTLTNYINEQKMIAAKEFVVNSTMPLTEISEILGFDNYNYFSRLFKKHFDRTPINMRKTEK